MNAKNFVLLSREDAEKSGLKHYFTGQPCKHGHIAPRRVSSTDCTVCSLERQRTDAVKQHKRAYYEKNKELLRSKAADRYVKNREAVIQKALDYQKKNIKRIYQRNKARLEAKLQEQPWLTIHLRLKAGLSAALRDVGSRKDGSRTFDVIGCTKQELIAHIERQFLKGMTWSNRNQWHIDHIVPVSKATTEEEVRALYHFTNLRPMWAVDNIRKSNKETHLI